MRRPLLARTLGMAIAVLALLLALVAVLALARGTPVEAVRSLAEAGMPGAREADFLPMLEAAVPTRIEAGNRVELLSNGDGTFPRLLADLRAARETILIEVYYWKDSALSDSIGAVLAERARAGVRVLLLFDAFGADVSDDYRGGLRRAGVQIALLRPVSVFDLHKAQQRSHLRAIVVDGVVGYTGGFGVDDLWLGDGRTRGQWRESNARFTGPAVAQLAGAFAAGWAEATGVLFVPPTSGAKGPLAAETPTSADSPGSADSLATTAVSGSGARAGIVFTSPTVGSTPAERLIALSIAAARERLYVANAYFVPDDDFRAMLIEAAARGVDVRVLAPSKDTDVPVVRHAARAHYDELLAGGVRIWEYQPTMMHSKTIVVDGVWSLVGTMNFDNRSLALNDEVTLAAWDSALGAEMERLFLEDLEHSLEIVADEFERRSSWERLKESGAVLLSRWL